LNARQRMPSPDWPAPAEQIQAARRFLQQVPPVGTVIPGDRDVDGLSAAVLTRRALERRGRSAVIVIARRGEHVHAEAMRARLRAMAPAALVVVAWGAAGSRSSPACRRSSWITISRVGCRPARRS